MTSAMYFLAGVVLVVCSTALLVEGGCGLSRLCCSGHNNTCAARGGRVRDPTSSICFCDEYCVNTGDCCTDYNRTCKAVDCELSDWLPWEECSVQCGRGVTTRRRKVVVNARNGGRVCDVTSERRLCWGTSCKVTRALNGVEELKETAKIIPAMFGAYRSSKKYDPFVDPLRRNLYEEYHKQTNEASLHRPTYYTIFTVVRSAAACGFDNTPAWVRQLAKGADVCIECQEFAMKKKLGVRCKGDGVLLKETRWDAVTASGCHGVWMKKKEAAEGTCASAKYEQSYIFV